MPWFACLVGSNLHSVDPTLRFGAHRVFGDTTSRAILKVSFADFTLCRSNAVFWPPHGFAGIVIDKFCQQSSQPFAGVNSVWATVFGRLLSIACGNIAPFNVRESAFAGFLSICSRAASFDPQIRFSASYDRTPAPSESVSSYFRSSRIYTIKFSAQVPCILVCVLCARLPTCGFLVPSAALEPLFGSLTLDSSR